MPSSDPDEAYTLSQAGLLVGVSPQRVSQMLKDGALTGPQYAVSPAPKNAPRVWKWSVDQLLAGRRARPTIDRPGRKDPGAEDDHQLGQWLARKEARINAAAQELKVAADLARQQAAHDRRKARGLTAKLANVVVRQAQVIDQLTADLTRDEDRTEAMLDAYSNALTQLLAPDDIGHL